MAEGRVLYKSISTSKKMKRLEQKVKAEKPVLAGYSLALYPLLVTHADDHGRFPADTFKVKYEVIPTFDPDEDDIKFMLKAMADVGLVDLYSVEGQEYLEIVNFKCDQRYYRKGLYPDKTGQIPSGGYKEELSATPDVTKNFGNFPKVSENDRNISDDFQKFPKDKERSRSRSRSRSRNYIGQDKDLILSEPEGSDECNDPPATPDVTKNFGNFPKVSENDRNISDDFQKFPKDKERSRSRSRSRSRNYIGQEKDLFLSEPEGSDECKDPPKPEKDPPKPEKPEYSQEFETWWKHYPRKVKKRAAFRCYKTRKKKYSAETLLAACKNYAKDCQQRGTAITYIAHPSTFLGPDKPFEDWISARGSPDRLSLNAKFENYDHTDPWGIREEKHRLSLNSKFDNYDHTDPWGIRAEKQRREAET